MRHPLLFAFWHLPGSSTRYIDAGHQKIPATNHGIARTEPLIHPGSFFGQKPTGVLFPGIMDIDLAMSDIIIAAKPPVSSRFSAVSLNIHIYNQEIHI